MPRTPGGIIGRFGSVLERPGYPQKFVGDAFKLVLNRRR
jgi:hypothetical protein